MAVSFALISDKKNISLGKIIINPGKTTVNPGFCKEKEPKRKETKLKEIKRNKTRPRAHIYS